MDELIRKVNELENRVLELERKEKRRKTFTIIRIVITLIVFILMGLSYYFVYKMIMDNYLNLLNFNF